MTEIEDGGGSPEQANTREHGYHPTMEIRPINKN